MGDNHYFQLDSMFASESITGLDKAQKYCALTSTVGARSKGLPTIDIDRPCNNLEQAKRQ